MTTEKFHSSHPLLTALLVSGLAALLSFLIPADYSALAVGFLFCGATYWFCLSASVQEPPTTFGLSAGGLTEPEPLRVQRLVSSFLRALLAAVLVSLVLFPPFTVGFLFWYDPPQSFDWSSALSLRAWGTEASVADWALGHLFVIALPEEAFFRGYLQTRLDQKRPPRCAFAGALIGPGLLWSSLLFALGHFATQPDPARLAVFFPSLVFGWLRARTQGIGAGVLFHAFCNLYAGFLASGYFI